MFREKYCSLNEQIYPDQELVNNVINISNRAESKAKNIFHKPITIVAAFMIFILFTTPALAANVPYVYKLMYLVSPAVAQFFMPVQKACVDNGIRMEVISAYIHDDTAEIYIAMQDLTGDRIDGTTDLYDSYSINPPFDSSAFCKFVGYEKPTKTATFLISITQWGNKKIAGDKITFSVREFISGKQTYSEIPIAEDLTGIDVMPTTTQVSVSGGSGPKLKEYFPDLQRKARVLVPTDPMDFPVKGINFTGIGYIEGMLHIQTSVENYSINDNHGYFFLRDKTGKNFLYDYNVAFSEDIDNDNKIHYEEYVFNIPKSEIGQYSLYGTFVTSEQHTEGSWQVTFPLEVKE